MNTHFRASAGEHCVQGHIRVSELGYETEIRRRRRLSRSRDVTCTREMLPTHAAITEGEAILAAVARELGGHEDGWGCLQP